MNPTEEMKAELLHLMRVKSNSDWGPSPIVCRWCACWLDYGDKIGKPKEEHTPKCFAVRILGRPTGAKGSGL